MKKKVWIVFLAIAIGSAFLPEGPKLMGATSGPRESHVPNANEESLESQIVAKEREGLEDLKNGQVEAFGALTADEAVLVDAHGPASKAQVLQNVAGFKLSEYSMEDMRFVPISATTGLISYKITERGSSHGREFTAQAYVSSVWTKRGNNWVCLFSQETGVPRQQNPAASQ
jgi:hypothetical protein